MKDVIVASRRAFNNVHLNEVTDWTGYVLPSSVQLSRMHTDGMCAGLRPMVVLLPSRKANNKNRLLTRCNCPSRRVIPKYT